MDQLECTKRQASYDSTTFPLGDFTHLRAMPAPNSTKGKRRQCGPKVRTGCKTCKIRRVKCDEARPKCQRCQKFGVICDGYERFQEPLLDTGLRRRKVLSKPSVSHYSDPVPVRYQALPLLRLVPLEPLFKSEQDYQYYAHFREKTALILSGGYDPSLWDRVVLQACEFEPSLRLLAVSLGALNKHSNSDDNSSLHWTYARIQYGKALKAIRESISSCQDPSVVRTALVAALLIFCWENAYGDPSLALKHIKTALALLRKQLSASRRRSYKHLRKISPTADLEFDLISTFARLDNYLLARYEHIDPTRVYILNMPFCQDEFTIPDVFTSINEAQMYLEHFQFRALPSIPHKYLVDIQTKPQTLNDYFQGDSTLSYVSFLNLSHQLGQWNKAFRPLFQRSRTAEGSKDFLPATFLRVQAVTADSLLRASHLSESVSKVKDLNDSAREVIALSRRAIAHPDFRRTFVFEVGIIPSLSSVLFTTQERSLREEIIDIGKDIYPRREGVWDSSNTITLGERLLEAEDKAVQLKV